MKAIIAVGTLLLISLTAFAQLGSAATSSGQKATAVADTSGHLHVPSNYRASYQFLGGWAIAADKGSGSQQIHFVYASPETVAAYKKTGHFPDGAVLVKEVYAAETGSMTTGTVSHAKTLKGWFVMVRDSKNRHSGNKLWGDGWGWSWFDVANPSKTTSTNYKTDCQGCHIPAKDSDWIYTYGYPVLQK